MQELLEKYKISHLETSDGKIYMMHEDVLTDLANEYHKKKLSICDVSVSLLDDDEIEKKAEFMQKPRNPNNDNKEEFIYGFMQGADWVKSIILPNER